MLLFNNFEFNSELDIKNLLESPIDDIYLVPSSKNTFFGILFVKSGILKSASFVFTLTNNKNYTTITFDEDIVHPLISEHKTINFKGFYTLTEILLLTKKFFNDNDVIFFDRKLLPKEIKENFEVNKKNRQIIKNTELFLNEIAPNIVFMSRISTNNHFLFKSSKLNKNEILEYLKKKI